MKNSICSIFGQMYVNVSYIQRFTSKIIEKLIVEENVKTFYVNGFGDFEVLCSNIIKELKQKYDVKLVYVLQKYYYDNNFVENIKNLFDDCIYLSSNNHSTNKIVSGNFSIVDASDFCLFYFEKGNKGLACKTMEYAKQQNKPCFNIYAFDTDYIIK